MSWITKSLEDKRDEIEGASQYATGQTYIEANTPSYDGGSDDTSSSGSEGDSSMWQDIQGLFSLIGGVQQDQSQMQMDYANGATQAVEDAGAAVANHYNNTTYDEIRKNISDDDGNITPESVSQTVNPTYGYTPLQTDYDDGALTTNFDGSDASYDYQNAPTADNLTGHISHAVKDWSNTVGADVQTVYDSGGADGKWKLYEDALAAPGMAIAATPYMPGQLKAAGLLLAAPSVISGALDAGKAGYNDVDGDGTGGVLGALGAVGNAMIAQPITDLANAVTHPIDTLNDIYEDPTDLWTKVLEPAMILEVPGRGAKKVYDNRGAIKEAASDIKENGVDGYIDKQIDNIGDTSYRSIDDGAVEQETATSDPVYEEPAPNSGIQTGSPYDSFINEMAEKYGVDPYTAHQIAEQESNHGKTSSNIFQVEPETGRAMGFDDVSDPYQSVEAGIKYYSQMLKDSGGNKEEALRRYNGGGDPNYVENVERHTFDGVEAPQNVDAGWEIRENEYLGQTMPHETNGCVEAVVRLGQDNDFLGREYAKGETYVPNLIEDARAEGRYIDGFDESRLEKGDVIVYDGDEHVVMYDGNGGYIGNSSSANQVVHGGDFREMGGRTPTGIIKTGGAKGSSARIMEDGMDIPDTDYNNLYGLEAEEARIRDENAHAFDEVNKSAKEESRWEDEPDIDALQDIDETKLQKTDYAAADKAQSWIGEEKAAEEPLNPVELTAARHRAIEDLQNHEPGTPEYIEAEKTVGYIDTYRDGIQSGMKPEEAKKLAYETHYPEEAKEAAFREDLQKIMEETADLKDPEVPHRPTWPELAKEDENIHWYGRGSTERLMQDDVDILLDDSRPNGGRENVLLKDEGKESSVPLQEEPAKGERPADVEPITRQEVMDNIEADYGVKLRENHTTPDNNMETNSFTNHGVIYTRDYGDITRITREIGEQQRVYETIGGDEALRHFDKELEAGFEKLYESGDFAAHDYGSLRGGGQENMRRNQVNTFVSEYLLDPNAAKQDFGRFYDYFEAKMTREAPELLEKMRKTQADLYRYQNQSISAKAEALSTKRGITRTLKEKWNHAKDKVKETIFDRSGSVEKYVDEAIEEKLGRKLTEDESVYNQVRNAQSAGSGQAELLLNSDFGKDGIITKGARKLLGSNHDTPEMRIEKSINAAFGKGTIPQGRGKNLGKIVEDFRDRVKHYSKDEQKRLMGDLDKALNVRRMLTLRDLEINRLTEEIGKAMETVERNKAARENISDSKVGGQVHRVTTEASAKAETRLKELERELQHAIEYKIGNLTKEEAERFLSESSPEVRHAMEEIHQYSKNLLDIAASAGLITKSLAAKLKRQDYIPVAEDLGKALEEAIGQSGSKRFTDIGSILTKLPDHGTTKDIHSAIETLQLNTQHILDVANRNKAINMMVDLINEDKYGLNSLGELATKIDLEKAEKLPQEKILYVYKDGKRYAYETEPIIKQAFDIIETPEQATWFGSMAKVAASLFRYSCTSTLSFLSKATFQDFWAAPLMSTGNRMAKPGFDQLRAIKSMLTKDQDWYDYTSSGARRSNLADVREANVGNTASNVYAGMDASAIRNVIRKGLDLYLMPGEMTENMTRLGKFIGDRKAGDSIMTAGIHAKDVAVDFSRAGTIGKKFNQYTTFFNAAIQGPYALKRAVAKNPKRAMAYMTFGFVLPATVLWMANHDQEWYQDLTDDEKEKNLYVTKDFKLPVPQEMSIVTAGVQHGLNTLLNGKSAGKEIKNLISHTASVLTPPMIPTIVRPILEGVTGKNFFDWYNPRSIGKKNISTTSQAVSNLTGMPSDKVDNLFRSSGGGMVSQGLDLIDAIKGERNMTIPKALRLGNAYRGSTYNKYVSQYHDVHGELSKAVQKVGGKKNIGSLDKTDRYNYLLLEEADKRMETNNKAKKKGWMSADEVEKRNGKIMRDAMKALKRK